MPETLGSTVADLIRQFPLLAVTLLVSWYFMRLLTRQQIRELQAKSDEIERLLKTKEEEIARLLEERRKYFQLFLKELRSADDPSTKRSGPLGPSERK
jgi:hypothetical protein